MRNDAKNMEANLRKRGVIKRDQVRVDGHVPQASARGDGAAAAPASHAPRVRLLRLDEASQAIEFTCSCGEVSLIEIQVEKKA